MRAFSQAVRYWVADISPLELHVGFAGPKVSKRWKHLARILQEGFAAGDMPESRRELLAGIGRRLGKGVKGRRFLFLRKQTRSFRTPARPMIEPFWKAYRNDAWRNIRRNYQRKLKGERI